MVDERSTIVLATNGKPREAGALRFVCAEAVRTGLPVTVVHVVHGSTATPSHNPVAYSYALADAEGREIVDRAAGWLDELSHGSVEVRPLSPRGRTVNALVGLSRSAYLMVLQRRGSSRTGRVLSGSTSNALAARSLAPVGSIPPGWGLEQPVVGRVVLGAGTRGGARNLFGRAFELAATHGAGLHVVRTLDLPSHAGTDTSTEMALHRSEIADDLAATLAPWRRRYPDVVVDVDIVDGRPQNGLLRGIRRNDLLVLGRRDVPYPAYEHVGAVTKAVLRTAECPVIVVPRPFAEFRACLTTGADDNHHAST